MHPTSQFVPSRRLNRWTLLAAALLVLPTISPAQSGGRRRHHSAPEAEAEKSPAASPAPSATPAASSKQTSAQEAAPSKHADDPPAAPSAAAVSSIEPSEIEGFDAQPEPIKQLLVAALELTKKNLTYKYGSDDPASGGMDCSGTISYLLKSHGFADVPRDASQQYAWARQKSRIYPVLSKKQDNSELRELRPGDLMFWTGTYNVDRDPPVTHAMIYLGKRKKDGRRLMFGSSDGRPYDGQRRNGVSVFDFRMPAAREGDAADAATAAAPERAPDFAGYGPIPGMADLTDAATRQTVAAKEPAAAKGNEHTAKADEEDAPKGKPSPTPRRRRSASRSGG